MLYQNLNHSNLNKVLDITNNAGIINSQVAVPLKQLSNFWRTLQMALNNCEIILFSRGQKNMNF